MPIARRSAEEYLGATRRCTPLHGEDTSIVEDSTMRCSLIGLIVTLTLRVLVAPLAVDAQAPVKVARIGSLRSTPETPEWRRNFDAFTQELRDHGYVEGQNVTFAFRPLTEPATPLAALPLELLQEAVPGLARVAVLWDPATGPIQLRGLESAARPVGVQLHVLEVRSVD